MTEYPSYAQIDAHRNVAFDAYGFWSSAGGGYEGRIPTGWRVWASQDGVDWQLIDAKADMKGSITVREYALQGPWNVARKFPLLNANNGAGNATAQRPRSTPSRQRPQARPKREGRNLLRPPRSPVRYLVPARSW